LFFLSCFIFFWRNIANSYTESSRHVLEFDMALVLHLTDLHLGSRGGAVAMGDYKSQFVPGSERVSRNHLITSTLEALAQHLRESGETLDAVVISGDITQAHALDGFEALDQTLGALGNCLPAPDHILVVPGNHDVKWGTDPSSAERYESFINHTRSRGYITPFLDGIDLPVADGTAHTDHQLFLDRGMVQIVALPSAAQTADSIANFPSRARGTRYSAAE
jgi:predicted MPP superfamily phosphohydrolase